jgi:hypothetical protein
LARQMMFLDKSRLVEAVVSVGPRLRHFSLQLAEKDTWRPEVAPLGDGVRADLPQCPHPSLSPLSGPPWERLGVPDAESGQRDAGGKAVTRRQRRKASTGGRGRNGGATRENRSSLARKKRRGGGNMWV